VKFLDKKDWCIGGVQVFECGFFWRCLGFTDEMAADDKVSLIRLDNIPEDSSVTLNPYQFVKEVALLVMALLDNPSYKKYKPLSPDEIIEKTKAVILAAYICITSSGVVSEYFEESFTGQDVSKLVILFQCYPQFDDKDGFEKFVLERYEFKNLLKERVTERLSAMMETAQARYSTIRNFIFLCCFLRHEKPPRISKKLSNGSLNLLKQQIEIFAPIFESQGRPTAQKLRSEYSAIRSALMGGWVI
jgi:hypothetical protein